MIDTPDVKDESPADVTQRYPDPAGMTRPDTLDSELAALGEAAFRDVHCQSKKGISGGRKAERLSGLYPQRDQRT